MAGIAVIALTYVAYFMRLLQVTRLIRILPGILATAFKP
jgi:hypothetical protein